MRISDWSSDVCSSDLLALIVWLVFRSRRAHQVTGDAAMLMDAGELLEAVVAGGESWMLVRGERWRVHCDTALPAGARVRGVQRQGLLLRVEPARSEEHTSELQSLMRIPYAVFCLKKNITTATNYPQTP